MVKRDLIGQLIFWTLVIVGIISLRIWFFDPVTITSSMANTYVKEKEVVLAAKREEIVHGDLVLYKVGGKKYVGRVVGLAGDKVIYMTDVLYRNDEIVEETYLAATELVSDDTSDFTLSSLTEGQSEVVTQGSYLILNDNRSNRVDSRQFGLITKKQVVGRLTFRVAPLDQFGFIDTGLAQ